MTHYDVSLMRISSVRLGTLSGRVTVEASISCGYTGTRYGEYGARREREVSQDARWRSACTELVREARACYSSWLFLLRCFVWVVSIVSFGDEASWAGFCDEASQTRKKEEALRRVLLFRWTVAGSLQSTCPDVCRRGHHWLYRRLHRHCRPR